jgi:hypothetical protein
MRGANRATLLAAGAVVAALSIHGVVTDAQSAAEPTNALPNPYQTVENAFTMPDGRTWGATSAVEIDRDGRSIWVAERCGANTCLDRATGQMSGLPSILKFDANGTLVRSFGAGMLIFPHGIHVDRDGNVWVTDGQDDAPQPSRGTGPAPPPRSGPLPGAARGSRQPWHRAVLRCAPPAGWCRIGAIEAPAVRCEGD